MAAKATRRARDAGNDLLNDLLSAEQRQTLFAAKAWWQEGERALDYLAEKARHEARLSQIQNLLADPSTRREADAETLAQLLRLVRTLSANRALNRTLVTKDFNDSLIDLLFGERALPVRLTSFLRTQRVGGQTASQLLYAAFPDRFPLVSSATRALLGSGRVQTKAARALAREQYGDVADETPRAVVLLLGDFVLYQAARMVLGVETFVDVNAILWHAREMPVAPARNRKAKQTSGNVVRETPGAYASPNVVEPVSPEATEQDVLRVLEGHVAAQGLTFPDLAVRDYYIALKTKPFVILAGLSGTGKTRLTELFADALTDNATGQYRLLPVRPDWTDATPLLGYYNLLSGEYVSTPFLDLLREADRPENRERAFFVCLDEMNLARVEHYFADVLSAMETTSRTVWLQNGPLVRFAPNVFVSGSVNLDEATHPFSKKVLDRANTLEFTEVRFAPYQADQPGARRVAIPAIPARERQRLFLRARVADVREAQEKLAALKPSFPPRVLDALVSLNDLLATRGVHFGYRVRDEVLMYIANSFDANNNGLLDTNPDTNLAVALDLQLVQKALPRLSGTQEALEALLVRLEDWAGDRFPRTRAKLAKMRRRASEEGTVTFYEP